MENEIKRSLENEIKELEPWFHNIHLPGGLQTASGHFLGDFPSFKWKEINPDIPEDLSGLTALDIGCNAGFYSIELAKRGADVLAIDLDPHYLKQAKWAATKFGLDDKIEFRQMQVYDLASLFQTFDIVWFMGVLYHLRYPLLALDIISQKVRDTLVFQTLTMPGNEIIEPPINLGIHERNVFLENGWPKMAFIENRLADDPTNWWAPNTACVEAMLRSCGFKIESKPGHEIFICKKDPDSKSVMNGWNQSEYLSAIGRDWKEAVVEKVKKD